jgi:DNA-binding MarR family transcriptional regulator
VRALEPQPSTEPGLPTGGADASPGLLLARLGSGAVQLFRDALDGTGLKPPHVAALAELAAEPVSQQALSEATGFDPPKLVGILNDLEAAKLVERRRDCLDRRRHIVAITAGGQARLEQVRRASAVAEEQLLRALSPAQRDQLGALLRIIIETTAVAEACPGQRDALEACASSAADACEAQAAHDR